MKENTGITRPEHYETDINQGLVPRIDVGQRKSTTAAWKVTWLLVVTICVSARWNQMAMRYTQN